MSLLAFPATPALTDLRRCAAAARSPCASVSGAGEGRSREEDQEETKRSLVKAVINR